MINVSAFVVVVSATLLAGADTAANLFSESPAKQIVLVVPERPEPLEKFAISELAKHIERITGKAPKMNSSGTVGSGNVVLIGRKESNRALARLADDGLFTVNRKEQGYSMRIDRNPQDPSGKSWLAVLCGADPHGVLYAVRDFCHYHLYKANEDDAVVLRRAKVSLAPRLKLRGLSASGYNLFSAEKQHKKYLVYPGHNRFSRGVVFDKHYYVDWLSEWKINYVSLLWCNYDGYDDARREFVKYAHSRGIKVLGFFVPFRPYHEAPPKSVSKVSLGSDAGDCPRDPKVRKWYFDRLADLVTREPKIDMIQIESPYHDGSYCKCPVCRGKENPYPEDKMLEEMLGVVRKHRPEIPVVRGTKQPVPSMEAARRLAEQLGKLEGPNDWHMNTYRNREHRRRWHDLGPKFATYLRLYRSALKGDDVVRDVNFLFDDFRLSAERDIVAHQFCYRFYGGRYGSFPIGNDQEMLKKYPGRLGPFSLALTAEAAFDPFVEGADRLRKIERIHALTIPDYPRDRPLPMEELRKNLAAGR